MGFGTVLALQHGRANRTVNPRSNDGTMGEKCSACPYSLILIVHIQGKRFLVTAFTQIVIVIETVTVFVLGALGLNCVTGIHVQEGTSPNACPGQTDSCALGTNKLTDLAFCQRPRVKGFVLSFVIHLFSYECTHLITSQLLHR